MILWMVAKSISHHLRNLANDDSSVNTNKQWFPIVSWVVQDFVHPQYFSVLNIGNEVFAPKEILRHGCTGGGFRGPLKTVGFPLAFLSPAKFVGRTHVLTF